MDLERKLRDLEERVSELEALLEPFKYCTSTVKLDGFTDMEIYGTGVPPVGSKFSAHKHTTDGGTYATFQVVSLEWELTDTIPCPIAEGGNRTMFGAIVNTKRVD